MDYDGDGILDIVSGSYDPGDIYLLKGLGKGKYAKAQPILDRAGVPLAHHPVELAKFNALPKDERNGDAAIQLRVASFGSWPCFVDWDADGDDDLLIGSFGGEIFLRTNAGSAKQPEWTPEAIRIDADGKPLTVNRHAAPAAADWNGDGLFDLVVGASDGSVCWFENGGERGKPKFGAARTLVPARSADKFVHYYVAKDQSPPPGVRAQVAVVDYDLDGRLDLLVGDYAGVTALRELTAAERVECDALVAQRAAIAEKIRGAGKDERAVAALEAESEAVKKKLETFSSPQPRAWPAYSFVWLYRRTD